MKPKIILITGESGSGKTTVANELCKHDGFDKIVSFTSREPRENDDHLFRTKEKLGNMMQRFPYVASTLIDDEIYVAFELQFGKNINVYIVDELGALNVINHIWWNVDKKPIHKNELLCVKLTNKNNNVEQERKDRYKLFLDDSFYDLIIENENIDKTVEMIMDEANKSMDN